MKNERKKLLVIGGGHAGVRFIHVFNQKHPKHQFDITLIDKKEFYELNFFNLWELARPEDLNGNHRILYEEFVNGAFIQGVVKELTKTEAILESGVRIAYDYAIIATGTSYPKFPIAKTDTTSISDASQKNKEEHNRLNNAKSVLIIGAGGVGVELAGEIKARLPHLEVQIVDMADAPLPQMHRRAQNAATKSLQDLGIKIYLNESIDLVNPKGNTYKTNSGKELTADRIFFSIGPKLNTDFLANHFQSSLTSVGEIQIDEHFRIVNTDNLFAIGDIVNNGDAKHGRFAFLQGAYLGTHFQDIINGRFVRNYRKKLLIAAFPVGTKKGIMQIGNTILVSKMVAKLKHSKFFLNYTRKMAGIAKI